MSYLNTAYPSLNIPSMPPSTHLGYSSNNIYPNFPPLMSDGRTVLASFQPESATNQYLLEKLGMKSNWEYRQYLQKNAKDIMKYNCMNMSNDVGYINRFDGSSHGPNVPQTFTSMTESNKNQSDLMNMYLSRETLNKKTDNSSAMPQYRML